MTRRSYPVKRTIFAIVFALLIAAAAAAPAFAESPYGFGPDNIAWD
jgi:hypothetical protein